jgi:hypothetical protein
VRGRAGAGASERIVLERQAERWLEAMQARWGDGPLPRLPVTEAERKALAAVHGWYDMPRLGTRLELIRGATQRPEGSQRAFYTLALWTWPDDFLARENFWLLPCQLAWSYAGVELCDNGLPEGVGIMDLPLPAAERPRKRKSRPRKAALAGNSREEEVANRVTTTAA